MDDNRGLTMGKKVVIVSLLSVIATFLLVIAILIGFKRDTSRTIMIYMSGNNLESKLGLASTDMDAILPERIDLEKTHVLVYTGGTKTWHNYVSNDENAIYELKANGYEKVKTYPKADMGNSTSLTTFLNYAYDNYEAGRYDLIMWDHGAGSLGSIEDEYTNDLLFLDEISAALSNSRFNSKNKIETVIFRTCLNGTLEMASVFAPYADYMVASEEVTIGVKGLNVLGFVNDVTEEDNGREFGQLFINSYQKQISDAEEMMLGEVDSTYAIINLNKMSLLYDKMNNFFSKIDVNSNYNDIARIRSVMHQYARDTEDIDDYDTVDLYELVDNLKLYSSSEAESLKSVLKNDVIVSNWSTNTHSNGLSVYFPYYSRAEIKQMHMNQYNKINVVDEYKNFITKFNNRKDDKTYSFSFDLSNKEVKKDGKEFSMKLTDEEKNNFSKAFYIVFRKEADGLFTPIYRGNDATLDKKGNLKTNITDNLITVVDENENSVNYFTTIQVETSGKNKEYTTTMIMNYVDYDNVGLSRIDTGTGHFIVDKNNNVYLDKIYLNNEKEDGSKETGGALADIDSYTSFDFLNFRYNILDANGNYTTNWESSATKYLFEVKKDAYHFELASLDSGDYYCVFVIFDVQNNAHYSNLISIN